MRTGLFLFQIPLKPFIDICWLLSSCCGQSALAFGADLHEGIVEGRLPACRPRGRGKEIKEFDDPNNPIGKYCQTCGHSGPP